MIKIYQRYIAKNILSSTLLVLFVLLALYTFMDFISELDDLGQGNYQLPDVLVYMALTMPKRIYELLPIAALIGSVIGLGNMATQSELVALRAAGISVNSIGKAVMIVAILLMLVAVFIGEVVRPITEQDAKEKQSIAMTGTVGTRSKFGFWTRDGNHFNHIEHIEPDGRFTGITIYEFDVHNRLRIITKAKEARYVNHDWVLHGVVQSTIDDKGVKVRSISRALWKSPLNPGMLNIVVVPPEFLPVWDLLQYIHYLKANHQSIQRYQLAFWNKIMMPLSSAVMVLLAVPFVFGPLRSAPMGGRVLIGTLAGAAFYLFNQSFQHLGVVYGIEPWLAASLPTIVFAGLGIYMLRRVH